MADNTIYALNTRRQVRAAKRAGYVVDWNGSGVPFISSPGKFEQEHPRVIELHAQAMEGDALASVEFGDSSWTAIVQDGDGTAWQVGESSDGFAYCAHVNRAVLDRDVAELEALGALLRYVEERDEAEASGVVFVADTCELDNLGAEYPEAVHVNDHGNAALYARDESGTWSERAAIV
jgi:hypothetical protein